MPPRDLPTAGLDASETLAIPPAIAMQDDPQVRSNSAGPTAHTGRKLK